MLCRGDRSHVERRCGFGRCWFVCLFVLLYISRMNECRWFRVVDVAALLVVIVFTSLLFLVSSCECCVPDVNNGQLQNKGGAPRAGGHDPPNASGL